MGLCPYTCFMKLFSLSWCSAGAWTCIGLLAAFAYLKHSVKRFSFNNKVALVTGGSAGIGLELAKALAERGCSVYIAARRKEVLDVALKEIKAAASAAGQGSQKQVYEAFSVDVIDEASIASMVEKIHAKSGKIDLCICNAGFSVPSRFLDITPKEGRSMMDVNFFGCVNVVRAVLPRMHEKKFGRVVLVSSMGSAACVAGFSMYSPTKAAVRAFAQAMDQENAAMGVRFQVLNPPDVATPGFDAENERKSQECKEICELGGATPFKSREVALETIKAIQNYSFQINVGFDGFMLGVLTCGMEVPTTVFQLFVQFFFNGLLRIVSALYVKWQYQIVDKVRRNEGKKK